MSLCHCPFSTNGSSALPLTFVHELENQEVVEGGTVTLHCELSKLGVPVEWRKGPEVIRSGQKYQMKQVGSTVELKILAVIPEDSGAYVCACGDNSTSANIKINGMIISPPTDKICFAVTNNGKSWPFVFLCLSLVFGY